VVSLIGFIDHWSLFISHLHELKIEHLKMENGKWKNEKYEK